MNLQWKSLLAIDNALRVVAKCYFMASAVCISRSQTADMRYKKKKRKGKHHFAVWLSVTRVYTTVM